MARLNKGEMILNMTQQSNLFDAINSGNLGSSNRVQIEFGKAKVLGPDILLSINNTLKNKERNHYELRIDLYDSFCKSPE